MKDKIIKLTNFVLKSARKYLEKEKFIEVVTPRVVRASGACENVNTLFEVSSDNDMKWFSGRNAYLAQTGQLYLEALVPSLKNVYCVGPSFRAEGAVDCRHLTEFQMIEIEHPGGFDELLCYIEGVISTIAHDVANSIAACTEFGLSKERVEKLKTCPKKFEKINYDQAIEILKNMGENIEWGDDINSKHEAALIKKFGDQPIFITRFPDPMHEFNKAIEVEKFFNMLPDPRNPGRVLSADMILPYSGEAVGAAARVHEADVLVMRLKNSRMYKRLIDRGGGLEDFAWYINQVKTNGAIPHAGCGFGISRIMQWILGCSDIREAVAFPSNKKILV